MNLPEENQIWRRNGKCVDLSIEVADKLFFFGSGGSPVRARNFCGNCPVKRECLHYAILHNQDGVWAGTTYDERNALKDLMLYRIIEQGLVTQDHFAQPESKKEPNDRKVDEVYPLELPKESYFPTAHVMAS